MNYNGNLIGIYVLNAKGNILKIKSFYLTGKYNFSRGTF